jgi:glycosyltransferase involved in cell wall biosynthesis
MTPPQVSVVIPVYNEAANISTALHSVLAQTFSDFEVILVDDGSTDTEALDRALQPYLSRIRCFRQQNRGPSSARNAGIREARGKYVAFLDSDDFWLPHHLARQMELLLMNPAVSLVYANAVHLKHNTPVGLAFDTAPQSGEPTLDALLAERCTVNTSSVVVLRTALLQAGLFDESMNRCEDFDLWLRLARAGVRMSYDRDIQVCHRLGEGLAANKILMKQGRTHAYQKMTAQPGLSPAQQNLIDKKLNDLDFEIQTELAKQALLSGRYEEALTAAKKAEVLARRGKLRLAVFGLRCAPGALRHLYITYLQVLERYKRMKGSHSTKDLKAAGKTLDFDSLIGHRTAP